MIHVFWAERYGAHLSEQRQDEVNIRAVEQKLARIIELDPRPLATRREPEKRLVGNCRDFSVMLTTLLRYQGIPAIPPAFTASKPACARIRAARALRIPEAQ